MFTAEEIEQRTPAWHLHVAAKLEASLSDPRATRDPDQARLAINNHLLWALAKAQVADELADTNRKDMR